MSLFDQYDEQTTTTEQNQIVSKTAEQIQTEQPAKETIAETETNPKTLQEQSKHPDYEKLNQTYPNLSFGEKKELLRHYRRDEEFERRNKELDEEIKKYEEAIEFEKKQKERKELRAKILPILDKIKQDLKSVEDILNNYIEQK